MPVSITALFKIKESNFKKTGAFNAMLDIDSNLFIDPCLLKKTKAKTLKKSYKHVQNHFKEIIKILPYSQKQNDVFWKAAAKKLTFPEIKGICLGYSKKSTSGSGMGQKIRDELLKTAKQIIDVGITDPEIFELVGIIQENIGPDRISDMVAGIIYGDLLNYTESIFKTLKVKCPTQTILGKSYQIPQNPFSNKPLVLVAKDIIRDLPIALDWSEIDLVCSENQQLRQKMNKLIGASWKAATKQKKLHLRKVLLNNPEVFEDLLKSYKQKVPTQYDFEEDRAGQYQWYIKSKDIALGHPLSLNLQKRPSIDDIAKVVETICLKVKDHFENHGLNKDLFEKSGKPKREDVAQRYFYGIADAYCEANNLDLSPETNAGRGAVDFKISEGYGIRVVVEVKLTTNKNLDKGFTKQLPEYQKAEKSKRGFYLVIDVGASDKKIKRFFKVASNLKKVNKPKIIFVNALLKPSASKL